MLALPDNVQVIPNLAHYLLDVISTAYEKQITSVHCSELHGILSQSFFLYRNHKNFMTK